MKQNLSDLRFNLIQLMGCGENTANKLLDKYSRAVISNMVNMSNNSIGIEIIDMTFDTVTISRDDFYKLKFDAQKAQDLQKAVKQAASVNKMLTEGNELRDKHLVEALDKIAELERHIEAFKNPLKSFIKKTQTENCYHPRKYRVDNDRWYCPDGCGYNVNY